MTQICTETDCTRPGYSRGLCSAHYQKARYHGTLPEPAKRACAHCGEPVEGRQWGAIYCSPKCNEGARLRRNHPIRKSGSCENCGTSLAGRRSHAKVCSERCGDAVRNARSSAERWNRIRSARKPCIGCGGSIPESLTSRARYCSRECRIRARRHEAYGLTHDELALLLAQHEACAICTTEDWGKKGPQVDHCHATGRVRGILCTSCNNGLGRFADDPARLRRAIEYLERGVSVG